MSKSRKAAQLVGESAGIRGIERILKIGTSTVMRNKLIDRLLGLGVKKIRTDRLTHYQRLTPKERHHSSVYGINHIERKNLTLRPNLKRLSRRTICFNRKFSILGKVRS